MYISLLLHSDKDPRSGLQDSAAAVHMDDTTSESYSENDSDDSDDSWDRYGARYHRNPAAAVHKDNYYLSMLYCGSRNLLGEWTGDDLPADYWDRH